MIISLPGIFHWHWGNQCALLTEACVWLSKLVGVSSDIVSLVVSRTTYRDTYRIVARRIVTPLTWTNVSLSSKVFSAESNFTRSSRELDPQHTFGDYNFTGLGFSRPKPVFPVQNGINWDKPVFPVQNWEKLSKTGKNYAALFFKPQKVPQNVMYQIKV